MSRRLRQLLLLAVLSPLALAQAAPVPAAAEICAAKTFASGGSAAGAIAEGRLLMWGVDAVGQLGQGHFSAVQASPVQVTTLTGLSTVKSVWLGPYDSFAVDGSGNAWGWGLNTFLQLGRPGLEFTTSPLRINGPTNVVNIGAGNNHTLAVTSDGSLWGWGFSSSGELNSVSNVALTTPHLISGPGTAAKVAAGDGFSLILASDGTVEGGGDNTGGQLGLGFTGQTLFVPIPGLSNVVDIAASQLGGGVFMVAADRNGNVFVSGSNFSGELGNGTTSPSIQRSVVQVPGLSSVIAIAAGAAHILALRTDGTVLAWGSNQQGQLGNGGISPNNATPTPVQFPGGTHLVAISAEQYGSMALDDQGGLWVWGDNSEAQVGNGTIGGQVTRPFKVGIAPVAAPCVPQRPRSYIPSRDGYSFNNSDPFTPPTYDQMRDYYPDSVDHMFTSGGSHTKVGQLFYDKLFVPAYTDGFCYGMATSDTFLYNRSSIHPETFSRWSGFSDPLRPDTLSPPLAFSSDQTIADFIKRFHSRQYGQLGAASSGAVWARYGFDIGFGLNRTNGNLAAFDDIANRVRTAPEVVAFGPSPFIAIGGPHFDLGTKLPTPAPDPGRWLTLFDNSHAVVAYATSTQPDGTRIIKVYDPSSVDSGGQMVADQSEIDVAPDGSVQLIDFAGGPSATPKAWIGGGFDSGGRNMGLPGDWILMPLPDVAFSESGSVLGQSNRHWVVDPAIALLLELSNNPVIFPPGTPIFHFSGQSPDSLAMQLPQGGAYDEVLAAQRPGASSSLTINGHLVTVTQTDANAAGSSHHLVIDPAATSIQLDSASQLETFNLEIAADYLPSYSRDISMSGVALTASQALSIGSDAQTSGLTITYSGPTARVIATTFEQDGANAGTATVRVTLPASSVPAAVSVFDWNALGTSLIFEVIDAQGTPSGQVLQGNASQLAAQVSSDLSSLQGTIAGITDNGLRTSLLAKVASAQDSFARGQTQAAANTIKALRNEVSAQAGKALNGATVTTLRSVSADALILIAAA